MAKQMGIIKLKGTVGDINFYKSIDGYLARQKGGVEGSRIASDPAFERTRENGAEFGSAGKAAKLLRNAFQILLLNVADSRLASRLTSEMVKVVKADTTSARGKRNVLDGELERLQGFDFNINGKLSTALYAPYQIEIDRATGLATVTVPPFVPIHKIAAPVGATHFRIKTGATEIDFGTGTYNVDTRETAILPLDGEPTAAVDLEVTLTADSEHPMFVVLGIEFLQMVNNEHYPLKNGAYNALALVQVSKA